MRLLSISSQVVAGHVGNAALAHPLACQGATLLAVPTVLFSNHPGYGRFAGRALPGEEVAALLEGLEAGGFLGGLDGLLTGYLGRPETALAAAETAARLRRGGCRYLLDPVLGDAGRLYVAEGIEAVVRDRLLPLAEAVTPNPFELERLTGQATGAAAQQLAAARLLLERGPGLVLVTSAAAPPGEAACLLVTPQGAWRLATPRLDFAVAPNGAGDLLAGLLLAELCRGAAALPAAEAALARLFRLLQATRAAGGRELAVLAERAEPPAPGAVTVTAL